MSEPTFGRWIQHAGEPLADLKHAILSGPNGAEFPPSECIRHLGPTDAPLKILDFGCGLGRNIVAMPAAWNVVGYDSPEMISRATDYLRDREKPPAVQLLADWQQIRSLRFDAVLSTLVFQHMTLPDLRATLRDLAVMAPRLVVQSAGELELVPGRRVLDEVLAVWYAGQFWPGDRDHWAGVFRVNL